MERRNFIQMGAAAGISAVAGVGCGAAGGSRPGGFDPTRMPGMDAFLAQLDRGMEGIAKGSPLKEFFPARAEPSNASHPHEKLVKTSLRSLLLVGSFRDLPEEARAHPEMQARMWGSMQEMDEAIFGMTHTLASFTSEERIRIREVLNEQPDLGMKIAESLDQDAVSAGVSAARRLHLRTLSTQLTFRLKHQPVTTLIDEYTAKVQKVSARHGYTEEMQRRLASQVLSHAYLGMQAGPPPAGSSALPPPPPPPPAGAEAKPAEKVAPSPYPYPYYDATRGGAPPPPLEDPEKPKSKPGTTAITVGAILMGVGATAGLIALGVGVGVGGIGGGVAAAFILTAGGVLLLAGLITLIVGLAIRASAD